MIYNEDDFIYETHGDTKEKSKFDECLQSKWNSSVEKGYFRYRLNITKSVILAGDYSFLVQLNPDRHENRRAPQEVTHISQPFNPDKFNFTKVKSCEFLFDIAKSGSPSSQHFLIINVSPLEYGHTLLLPSLFSCLPQVATLESLQLAIEILLLSSTPSLRIGFNGLCAYASVNHLHYHLYYLNHRMLLEHIDVEHLSGPCYLLLKYPAPGFVFQLPDNRSVHDLARNVHRLTNFFQSKNLPHNLYMTRGSKFGTTCSYDTVRVYLWVRKPSYNTKEVLSLKIALCELFGHFVLKSEVDYNSVTEETLASLISDFTVDVFADVRDSVKQLFA